MLVQTTLPQTHPPPGMVHRKHAPSPAQIKAMGMLTSEAGLTVLRRLLAGSWDRAGAVWGAVPRLYWHHVLQYMAEVPSLLADVMEEAAGSAVMAPCQDHVQVGCWLFFFR